MATTREEVVFRKGPGATLPQQKVPGTLLVDTDTGSVYLDCIKNGIKTRITLKDNTKMPISDGTTEATPLPPGAFVEVKNEGSEGSTKIDGSGITIESSPGNIIFQIKNNTVTMSPELIAAFQELLLGDIDVEVVQLPEGSSPTGKIQGKTLIFGFPPSMSGGTANGLNDGHLHDTGEVDPPNPPDEPTDYDDGTLELNSPPGPDLDDGAFNDMPTKDVDDGTL